MLRLTFLSAILIALLYIIWLTYQVPTEGDLAAEAPQARPSAGSFSVRQVDIPGTGPKREYAYEEPQDEFARHALNTWFSSRQYHAYDGSNGDAGQTRPGVFLLHGSGRTGASMIDMWKPVADRHGIVLIAPDSANRKGWSGGSDSASFFTDLIEDAVERYNLDPDRLFVFGHSSGGVHATRLAQNADMPFRAVATHAGFPPASDIDVSNGRMGRKPVIRYYLGDRDHIFDVDDAMELGEVLKQAGYDTQLVVVRDHTHWYYDIGPSIGERVWQFFEQQ